MSDNKQYLTPDGKWWLKYFESTEEEQTETMFHVAVGIMWGNGQLDRDGWTTPQRNRISELTAELSPALGGIDYNDLTTDGFKEKTDALGITDKVLEMQNIWQQVARAKASLDRLLADQEKNNASQ